MKKENTTTLVEEVLRDTEILEEAITERVREKLNEEFVPKIRSMIQKEMDGDEEDEDILDEPIETEQDEYTEEEPLIPDEEEAVEEQEEIPLEDEEEEVTEQEEGDEDLEFDIEDDDEEMSLEQDEIPLDDEDEEELNIEQEEVPLDDEDEEEMSLEQDEEEWQDDEEEMPMEQDESDIEFEDEDEIIEVIDDEGEEEEEEVMETLKRENKQLKRSLQEIRNKLNNALILNEQFKHAQEFFKKYSLTRDQKKTIVNQISKATTMQRIKLVSESLHKMIGVMPQIQKRNPSNSKKVNVVQKKQLVKENAYNLLKEEIDVPDLFTKDQKANWKKLSGMIN